jgi:hypothetical protein
LRRADLLVISVRYRASERRYEEYRTVSLADSRTNSYVLNDLEAGVQYDLFIQPFYW